MRRNIFLPKMATKVVSDSAKRIEEELKNDHFRVAIFGSARIRTGDYRYDRVFHLAKNIAYQNIDIITGGGPGIMEAANAGHHAGRNGEESHSIGMTIHLPFEEYVNRHLDIHHHFERFSDRLDHFMALSHVVVVISGGIGTCLELFYTWQLTQVKHMCKIPIILYGEMWEGLYKWIENEPLKNGFISPKDMENIYIAKKNQDVIRVIKEYQERFLDPNDDSCKKKYILDD
jgi:uncharacterized protein (TIGR00730 family)